jgi:hypothetical protein
MTRPAIVLHSVEREGIRINYRFRSDVPVFVRDSFFVEYADLPTDVPDSILNVVFAAVVAPVAWATGADLHIPCLDSVYLGSLESCQAYFRKWHPREWSFESRIIARAEDNPRRGEDCGMLFSGGLDALTTYIKHRSRKPELFTVFGVDVPLSEAAFTVRCRGLIQDMAAHDGVTAYFISTDVREVLPDQAMRRYSSGWYGEVAHMMLLTALTAPYVYGRISELLVAGGDAEPIDEMWGSDPDLDEKISWSGTTVKHDNFGLDREAKVIQYFREAPYLHKYLRVCWVQFGQLNCSCCDKCLGTIVALLIANIDPNTCNFHVDEKTLVGLRNRLANPFLRHAFIHGGEAHLRDWRFLLRSIHESDLVDIHGSRAFLTWLKGTPGLFDKQDPVFRSLVAGLCRIKALLNRLLGLKK